jgi:hypothetical protein
MKDANQGQKAFTRFSGNQFDDRKGDGKSKSAAKGGAQAQAGAESKPAAKGAKPAGAKLSGVHSSRPGAKAPFGQSGFKAGGAQAKSSAKGGSPSKTGGKPAGKPSQGRQQAK